MRKVKDSSLRRFWIEYDGGDHRLPFGFGVTAIDREDAIGLIEQEWSHLAPFPPIRLVIEDVDVGELRERHDHLPWMTPPIWRGVWYPGFGDVMRKPHV